MLKEKSTKVLNILFMIEKWSMNLRRNFDDLECNIDELYPHLKKIKKIILKDIEDGNMTLNELCDLIEEEEAKYYS